MVASVRQEWPTAWTAASATTVASGAAPSACVTGNTIAVWLVWNSAGATLPTSVVDSASQTYTYAGGNVNDGNTSLNLALYYFKNNASATALTITATWASAQTYRGMFPAELQGVSSNPFQVIGGQAQDGPGAGTGAISSGNVTPTSQPCLLYALTMDASANGQTVVAGSLNSGSTGLLLSGNSFPSALSANLRLTSTAAIAATFTNATDAAASFLTAASIWSETASGNTASIAWVV